MAPIFFQKFWLVVGKFVTSTMMHALNKGAISSPLNHTHVILILKKKSLERVVDYHLISLCNVIYKILYKFLTDKLKKWISQLISPSQSAFVPGWLITDDVLMAQKLMHHLNTKRQGESSYMAIKLDVSKAYDRVE